MILVAGALAGCDKARPPSGGGGGGANGTGDQGCTRCHGGGDNQTGAPPVSVTGRRDTTFPGVGAHTAHVTQGALTGAYDCAQCHPDPRSGSKQHGDGKVELAFGALATAGGKLAPALDTATNRCGNVYCHGATLSGGANVTPEWTKVGQGEAGCGTCHGVPPPAPHPAVLDGALGCQACHATTVDATGAVIQASAGGKHLNGQVDSGHPPAFMDPASSGFHALWADRGLATCQLCHGQELDGGLASVACASCHTSSWRTTCTMCHGGIDNQTGAPPRSIFGQSADLVRVGAHTAHVTGGDVASPFDCGVCHVKPTDALSPGHVDAIAPDGVPLASVTFLGLASQGTTPNWNRASATCASTYCHGAFQGGNGSNTPVWTSGAGQAACGTCHGLPPPSPHPHVLGGLTACNPCHPQTVDASGRLIPPSTGGKHLDGQIQGTGGHDASWMDPSSANFHAFTADRDIASCTACHGASLEGGLAPACTSCHTAGGTAPDFVGCLGCHGGVDNSTGAPPRAIWGSAADPARGGGSVAERAIRVGAHTPHVTGGALAPAFDCSACHVTPAAILSASHIDSPSAIATVTFGALARTGGAAPGWNRTGASCSGTYCHGATLSGGSNTAPTWTAGATQAACGTCHGLPPLAPHPAVAAGVAGCVVCHADSVTAAGAVIPPSSGGKHLNGRVDGNHPASWMDRSSPDFHAFQANAGLATCQACHGKLLDGSGPVSTLACARCHGVGWATTCTMCHGGIDNTTGAPPTATWGNAGDPSRGGGTADPIRVGAHTAHVTASAVAPAFDCSACHVKPADAFAASHIDGSTATVTFGGLAAQGVGQPGPTWTRAGATCASTYCHGAFQGGNGSNTPVWTAGAAQAVCGSCHGLPPAAPHPAITGGLTSCNPCHPATIDASGALIPPANGGKHLDGVVEATGGHDASWMDPASAGFHASSANRGLSSCQPCHGTNLDGVGGSTTVGCQQCHGPTWRTNCVMCHGGVDNQTGAPPKTTWGQGGDAVRIGAHTPHVTGSALAPAFGCAVCHVTPTDALAAGHIDAATATVTFSGLASQGTNPTWTRGAASCAATYCHGATLAGGSIAAPVWTAGATQAVCGTCHGIPPPPPHPAVTGGRPACNGCHGATVDASGNVIPPASGGKHLDGVVEATGGHDASWMDRTSAGFHAFSADSGISQCQGCHGQALDGGNAGVACASCHQAGGTANDFATCTACHGGTDNATGAPPKATWGRAGDPSRGGGTADPIRVGAHTIHVSGSAIAPAMGCEVCHVKPASIIAAGHVDQPTATLTFGGLAITQGAVPIWTRSAATCASTYCHGAFQGGSIGNAPVWTGGSSQGACGTCHGTPPPAPHPAVTGGLPACNTCHSQTIDTTGAIIPPASGGKHLDGVVEATGHDASWMDRASAGFHAFSADAGIAQCQGCHGQALDGGNTGVACAGCHQAGGTANDFATCTACHGGTDNATGAPPKATWGRAGDPNRGGGTADPIRVGAHTVHVSGSAIAPAMGCEVCHVKPASIVAPGHVDQPTATLTFSDLAITQGAVPIWTRSAATCASTYCHGAFQGGSIGNAPVWTGGSSQGACGTCHGTPPPAPHPAVTGGLPACNTCHSQTIDTTGAIIPPASGGKHLDGVVEATGGHDASWMDRTSAGFHAFSADAGIAQCQGCHGQALDGGSANVACAGCHQAGGTANDFATCTACHGGTDNATGAPPKATWGRAGDPNRGGGTADPIRVGAHTVHVSGSAIAPAMGCGGCHVTPTSILSPGHLDGPTATVTFGALPSQGTTPTWTRASATCANTYCHGAYTGSYTIIAYWGTASATYAGNYATPTWTGGPMTCTSCHGAPPASGGALWHNGHPGGDNCDLCHPNVNSTGTAITDQTLHVNGVVDVDGAACASCH